MAKPVIGVTMGDPAGIGPEITVKALSKSTLLTLCRPIVIGDVAVLRQTASQNGLRVDMTPVMLPVGQSQIGPFLEVVDLGNVDWQQLQVGQVSEASGRASIEYVEVGVQHALNGELDALVTAPINKAAIRLAGCPFIGHTELLGALTGIVDPLTMFWIQGVRIFFLTRHLPLRKALDAITEEKIVDHVDRISSALRRLGLISPVIAIAALNPHASDGGLVGTEEHAEIAPAVAALQSRGVRAVGPIAADAIFHNAFQGKYDAVLSLYHDQGHIAAKTVDFHRTVSGTLGLPFIRTSVDHGTAMDIAGEGIADPTSLREAIRVAVELCASRREEQV
jgi:4-hydroxythreonine-4-phosphate dehydrogenase